MMKRIAPTRRDCLATLGSYALAASNLAASSTRRWPNVQKVLQQFVQERSAAGVTVAISYAGSSPSFPSAGTLAFDCPTPMDDNSICRIYSMTKNVTRIAALMLVEDGKLALDQAVADVLPEFKNLQVAVDFEKGLEARPARNIMTMRHLLTNTSGLGNWTPASDSGEQLHRLYRERGITPGSYGTGRSRPGFGKQPASLDEMIARVAELPLAYEPGTVLYYSIGFDVMACVIERITRMTYGAFLQRRLFGPLKMKDTGFQIKPGTANRLTTNYDATERAVNSAPNAAPEPGLPAGWHVQDDRRTSDWLQPPLLVAGGAGLVSTPRDFLRYTQMLLHEGALGSTRVMSVETARLANGNINPPGVAEPTAVAGAGTRALLRSPIIPDGMVGAGGSAGTLFWIDQKRQGAVVFFAQAMYGSPARSPYQKRLFAAIEADLKEIGG